MYVWNGRFIGRIFWLEYVFEDGYCGDVFLQVGWLPKLVV